MKIINRDHSQILQRSLRIIVKHRIFLMLIVFSVILIPIQINHIYANDEPICSPDLTIGASGQCVPKCGEGTVMNSTTGICETAPEETDTFGQIEYIATGIVAGVGATVFGIIWTIVQRIKDNKREDLEFIQNYGDQLAEINSKEDELSTKLDCALYAENYLDVLEQIATLFQEKLLRKKVAEYFVNNFRYGMNLWIWYKKNVEKMPEYELNQILENNNVSDLDETDRWYWFRLWCVTSEDDLSAFESQDMGKILVERMDKLQIAINKSETPERVVHFRRKMNILRLIAEKLARQPNGEGLEEEDIREIFDVENGFLEERNRFTDEEILDYVRKYNKNATNNILPDLMEEEYDDIPDENGLSNFEILETIREFSTKINLIKDQERRLYSKLDCTIYAEQYLDTVDQIATLYRKKLFPKDATTYFANHFGYGINILNWYYKFVLHKQEEFDPDLPITEAELRNESKEEDRWIDFRWICRGGDSRKEGERIKRFVRTDDTITGALREKIGNEIVLPMTMYQYEDLPEEEGINPDEVLETMKAYGDDMIKLTEKETSLKTKIDCSVYAEMYLDLIKLHICLTTKL